MGRTPNDDRSDTMNPNNDAYAADQANRYDDDDDLPDATTPSSRAPGPALDQRFGPDPHPVLGRRSNRLPGLGCNFEHHKSPQLVPWTETLAISFATAETEARDRKLAGDELMLVAAWLFAQASAIAVRQGHVPSVERSESASEDEDVTFRIGAHSLTVRTSQRLGLTLVGGSAFRFVGLRWHRVDADYGAGGGREVVGYHERNARLADPAHEIFETLRRWDGRKLSR